MARLKLGVHFHVVGLPTLYTALGLSSGIVRTKENHYEPINK